MTISLERDPRTVLFCVKDTEPGIKPEDQQVIFAGFRQGAHANAGSGLGLHLVQRIVTMHQGNISVNS